jgi:hypothetical protein
MEYEPLQNDLRKTRRRRKLGANAVCILCGETAPEALRLVSRSLLEGHHAVGASNDPTLKIPVCRNCHAKETEAMRAVGVDLRHIPPRTILEVLVPILRALGAFFHDLADMLFVWADRLLTLIRALDGCCPQWRALPEAQV